MVPSLMLVPSLLALALVCPSWYSNANATPDEEHLEASGQEEQQDPIPDPAGGFCQRNKNPKGLGFIGVGYDLLKGNPEGRTSLGGADPGLKITKKIFKLTKDEGDEVPIQICYEERQLCTMSKSSKIFGGTKRYQDKLNVDVSAEGKLLGRKRKKKACQLDILVCILTGSNNKHLMAGPTEAVSLFSRASQCSPRRSPLGQPFKCSFDLEDFYFFGVYIKWK